MKIKHNSMIYNLDDFLNINLINTEQGCELYLDDLYIKTYTNQEKAVQILQKIYNNPNKIYKI